MTTGPGATRWRGWDRTSTGRTGLVTSTRLGDDAAVQNRMFPKVRSWFALGAPLELLSPLSVVRIVVILLGIGAGLAALAGFTTVPIVAIVLGAIAVVTLLTRVKELGARQFEWILATITVAVGTLVATGPRAAELLVPTLLLMLVAISAGMFLPGRRLTFHIGFATLVIGTAVSIAGHPLATIVAVTVVTAAATATVSMTVALTVAAARRNALVDADTGIPNGYGFAARLARDLEGGTVVVAVLDLGGLNEARDALGHRAGTELVRRAVEDLGQVVPAGSALGRVDGDRLIAARPVSGTDIDTAALAFAEHLASGIGAGRYLVDAIEVILRPHVGIAVGPTDSDDATHLIRRATIAAIRAAGAGRRAVRWDPTMTGAMTSADLNLLADLRLAPERGELTMAYQPQIDPRTGATAAVEALIRWTSPVHGAVSPDRFVRLAECTGLIDRITDWVLAETLDAQVRWRRVGLRVPVSVNVSAGSLSDPDFPDKVLRMLHERRLPGDSVTVEVTETAALDAEQAADRLGALHAAGVGTSIDDFGTGYTSLAVLPHLPVDELKVDQRFVMASATSAADDAIVRSVLNLAHEIGMRSVAEGVEDTETANRLAGYGFDLLQGWAFSKALPESELMTFLCSEPHAAAMAPAGSSAARVEGVGLPVRVTPPRGRR